MAHRHHSRSWWAWASALCVCFATLSARAEVTLPNGKVVPVDSGSKEQQLYNLFISRNENIVYDKDGFATPNTFSPLCNFKATFVMKQSSSSLAVGWYNVKADKTAAPDLATEIFQIMPAGSAVYPADGSVVDSADIRTNPNYKGGLIGFALMRTPPHYSEADYNTYCSSCATPGHWILSISYRSTQTPNAYYLAFEDGDTSSSDFGNDGDYNDYVFLFEGLACAGDGTVCEVPDAKGVCKDGINECDNTGSLTCKPRTKPGKETCDALDNDCNGKVDDGDICPDGKVCSRGVCVPTCGEAEFVCINKPYTECENGLCVEPECKGKTCNEGEVCIKGACIDACKGVVCPNGKTCRFGACIDPCEGVTCTDQRVCVDGACVLSCECSGCADKATSCDTTGLCIDSDCKGKTCDTGQFCADTGTCTDACAGAKCPAGSECKMGDCVPMPVSPDKDAGVILPPGDGDGGDGDGLPPPHLDGGSKGDDAGPTAGDGDGAASVNVKKSGCGCRVPGSRDAPGQRGGSLFALLVLGSLLIRRRRRF